MDGRYEHPVAASCLYQIEALSNVIVVDATADLNKSRTNLAYIQADVFIIDALDRSFGHVALRKIRAHWNAMESVGDFISLRPIP